MALMWGAMNSPASDPRASQATGLWNNRHELVEYLIASGILESAAVIEAFYQVDRADFVLPELSAVAYEDHALSIGFGQTISQPSVVAFMLELLSPQPGEKILDVGSGSGWTTALLAVLVKAAGKVYGTEIVPELVEFGKNNLAKYELPNAGIVQSGSSLGLMSEGPFDKILVSAAGTEVPQELIEQLATGGVMVMPVNNAIWQVKKLSPQEMETSRFGGFAFVPLRRCL